tara:strand:+ start:568 stop:762 length:195 start_codon:yes stop_codon:yes gene_type:complete
MTDVVNAVKNGANKIYKNGKTLAENVQSGLFIPPKALKNHKEVMDKIDSVEKKMDLILSMIAKK